MSTVRDMRKLTRTRTQGVYQRHQQSCRLSHGGDRCSCSPVFYGQAYDRQAKRKQTTKRYPSRQEAATALQDLRRRLELPRQETVLFGEAAALFLDLAASARIPNKRGEPYKPTALKDIEYALRTHVLPVLGGMDLTVVRRRDVQLMVDMMEGKSSSRIRGAVNAVHVVYRLAFVREWAEMDPATHLMLPAVQPSVRDRVLEPGEARGLLAVLPKVDALPFALALTTTARRSEIRHLQWKDMKDGLVELGADPRARKSHNAKRYAPIVPLLEECLPERGTGLVCPGTSGMLSVEALQSRCDDVWARNGLARVTLHECRHTCISWLDAAGVRGTVVSAIAGHALSTASAVTARYTHIQEQDVLDAGRMLDEWLSVANPVAAGKKPSKRKAG